MILTAAVSVGLADSAGAGTLEWSGTLTVKMPLGGNLPPFVHLGTGVATVNGSSGGNHLNTIRFGGGLSYTGGNNVPEAILFTDPYDPDLVSLRATGIRLGTLTFNGISGGPPLGSKNTGVQPGHMKLCIMFPGCGNYLPIAFTGHMTFVSAVGGIGVGGIVTVNTFSKGGAYKFSIQGAPWTIGLASIRDVTTDTPNGAIITYTATIQGFVHGPASATSNTAAISGVLQMVTPIRIQTIALGLPDTSKAAWADFRLHFIPEPGLLLLLASGVGGLLMLGRSRMRG